MRKIIVKVDKEKATELERVNFELNFVKDIVQRVIDGKGIYPRMPRRSSV